MKQFKQKEKKKEVKRILKKYDSLIRRWYEKKIHAKKVTFREKKKEKKMANGNRIKKKYQKWLERNGKLKKLLKNKEVKRIKNTIF